MDSEMKSDETEAPAIEVSPQGEAESRTLDDDELKLAKTGLRLNKENVDAQTRTPCEPTPRRAGGGGGALSYRPHFHLHTPVTQEQTPLSRPFLTPKTESKVASAADPSGTTSKLRTHFAQMALTPKRPHVETGVRIEVPSKTPKRMLATGAVRIEQTPKRHPPKSIKKTKQRVGYDGTIHTPSRELLRSTACSRNHRITQPDQEETNTTTQITTTTPPMSPLTSTTPPPLDDNGAGELSEESVLDGSLDSSLVRSPIMEQIHDRQGCENPVAMTLLNDGTEDLHHLLERDVEFVSSNGDDSTVASCPSLLKVSSSLLDVMDQSDVAGLAKPVPFRACRSQP